ncbi:MAG: APA family basic amino acid/polyamine antiporter [Myxococcota bacterium]|jgi:APA family basic amino acid/polyamine antiporter
MTQTTSADPLELPNTPAPPEGLTKKLGLRDVYAISTGAMFGSGFFLLPGVAAAQTGSSVALAYVCAAILAIPAMLCVAELSTAMPKAGGAYFFLERALGPLAGTIGGLGTWLALVLKSAFALLGMGAYLAIVVDIPIKPLAVALTMIFGAVNVIGAKESAGLQRMLVYALIGIVTYFIAEAAFTVLAVQDADLTYSNLGPFLPEGLEGFVATIGLVFVSYAGLTKVASVAEEVQNPDRNLPLGMALSLLTAAVLYGVGIFLLNALLPAATFHTDLTPLASAVEPAFQLMPGDVALPLMIIAAFAAFASTANAGVMASSRYPYAMARDGLVSPRFIKLSRFGTPTLGILATCVLMIIFIVGFDITAVAKLASAFQLMLFALLGLAVIVMRESQLSYYRPGFKLPFYPWLPLVGILIPVVLIAMMGAMTILLTLAAVLLCAAWYVVYVRHRVSGRAGAIYHVFRRLGQRAHHSLDAELRAIVAERGGVEVDAYESLVERARVVDIAGTFSFAELSDRVGAEAAEAYGLDGRWLAQRLRDEGAIGVIPTVPGVALPHIRVGSRLDRDELILVRLGDGVSLDLPESKPNTVFAFLVLLTSLDDEATDLHLHAQLAATATESRFTSEWRNDVDNKQLRTTVLGRRRYLTITVERGGPFDSWIDARVDALSLPPGVMIAVLQRAGADFVPREREIVELHDRLTLIGDPHRLDLLRRSGSPERRTKRLLTPPPHAGTTPNTLGDNKS